MTTTRVLSVHATYGCRDSGVCCTSGWPIPIEADRLACAQAALASGAINVRAPAFVRSPGAPVDTPALVALHDDACVFYRGEGAGRCSLHRTLGHEALPLACRQFPRISVIDPRGVSLTLSHYCPTAAAMIDTGDSVSIVADAPAFPASGEYVGLDVRTALPPALRPDMLMDWESWWLLEAGAIALLSTQLDPDEAVVRLGVATEHVRGWIPADSPLAVRVSSAFEAARAADPPAVALRTFEQVATGVLDAVPDDLRARAGTVLSRRTSTTSPHAHVAFLAAHTFANWTAHLGEGLRTWWRSIEAAHGLLSAGLSVRDADLRLRHLADQHALARVWGQTEEIRAGTRPALDT